jgi:hypothetical protein
VIKKLGVLPASGEGSPKCGGSICAAILVFPVRYLLPLTHDYETYLKEF